VNIQTEELADSQVALSFEIDDARVERAMDAASRRVAGRVNIAGFRRGKAPRSLVERVVGRESLLEEALSELLPEAYREALLTTEVRALTDPEFDVESVSPLRARATVVVRPEINLGDYQSIRHAPPSGSVEEEEVDAFLQQLRESHAEWVPADRPAQIGDRVALDVSGTVDGRTVIHEDDADYLIRAESNVPVPGFAVQLVGLEPGMTRTFDLDGPADADGELAGKSLSFSVTINEVKAKELPELDDFFATTVGSYADLAELRSQVTAQLSERAEAVAKISLEEEVLKEAADGATVAIPDKLVDQQAHRLRDRLERELDSRGLTIEQYMRVRRTNEAELESEFRAEAERSLKRSFVLQAIAEAQELSVSEDEVDASTREALGGDAGGNRSANRALRQAEIRDRVRTALLEQRAASWLVEHATEGGDPPEPVEPRASRRRRSHD
jgi:trigger factor